MNDPSLQTLGSENLSSSTLILYGYPKDTWLTLDERMKIILRESWTGKHPVGGWIED